MTRRKIILSICAAILAAVLLLLLGGFLWLTQNQDWLRDKIIAGLEENFGQSCQVDKAELVFDPWPFLRIQGAASQGDNLTLALKRAVIAPDVSDLFLGQVNLDHIELEDPLVEIADLESLLGLSAKEKSSQDDLGEFDLPSGCRVIIKNGNFKIKTRANDFLDIKRLDCYLSTGFLSGLSGDLTIQSGQVRYQDQEFFFDNLLVLGDVNLADFRRSKLDCKVYLKNNAWLKGLDLSSSMGPIDGFFEARTKIAGQFIKDDALLDFFWQSDVRLVDQKHLLIKKADFALGDRDSGTLRGDLDLEKYSLAGNLKMPRVSLTEWLTFARNLPPGLQISLDNVLNADLDFVIDGNKLEVSRVEADCQGAHFAGIGGVNDWRKPVVFLDMQAPKVNLIAGIPEAGATLPEGPIFDHGPLTPENDPSPGPSSVGYDIRLGADLLKYGPLLIKKAKVIIHPAPLNAKGWEDILLDATAHFYDGSFKGSLQLGGTTETTFNIKVSLHDVNGSGVGRAMPIIPVRKGKWTAQAQVTSLGTKLAVFLKNLRGTVKVDGRHGEVALPKSTKNIPFVNLAARLDPLKFGQWQGSMLGIEGNWKLNMEHTTGKINADMPGKLWFGRKHKLAGLECQNVPVQLTYRVDLPGTKTKDFTVQAKTKLTYLLQGNSLRLQDLALNMPGMDYVAHGDLGPQKDGFLLKTQGDLVVHDLSQTLASMHGQTNVPKEFNQMSGSVNCKVTPNHLTLETSNMRTGLGNIYGQISYPLAKHDPLQLDLNLDLFDLDAYLAKNKSDPHKKLDFSELKSLALHGSLKIKDLTFKKLHFFKVNLPFLLKGGRLVINPVEGLLYGGSLKGIANITLWPKISLETSGKLSAADLGWLARDKMDKCIMAGQGNLAGAFKAQFSSVADWPNCLDGTWNLRVFNGKYQPLDSRDRPKGAATTFKILQASGRIKNALLTSNDVFLQGSDLQLKGSGEFNLNSQDIDCKFNVNKSGLPNFPLYIYGKLGKVKTSIGAGQFILNAIGGIFSGFK